jgi:lipopolysaccharide exporter
MATLKDEAFRNMKWTGFSTTYVSAVQLLNIIVLAFFLTPSEIGTMSALLIIIWFTQTVSDGGLSPAIIHFKHNPPGLLNTLFYLNLLFAVILYITVVLFADSFSILFDEPTLSDLIPVAISVILISAFSNQFKVFLMREIKFDLIARQEVTNVTVYAITAISLAYLGFGVWAMIIGYISGVTLGTILLYLYGSKYWKPGLNCSITGIKPYLDFGKFQLGERITLFFNTRIDQLLVGMLLGTQSLGIYTVAHNVVVSPTTRVNQVISTVMFPVFSRLQDDENVLRNGYLKLIKLVTLINTPLMLGMAITAPYFIPLLFSSEWVSSIYIIQILCFYSLIRSTGTPAGSLQLAKGRTDIGFKWNLSLVFITIPFIYAGALYNGLNGIAYAQVLLHLILFVPYWIFAIRPLIGPPAFDYFKSIISATLPGILMAVSLFGILFVIQFNSDSLILTLSILVGGLLYLVFAYYTEKKLFTEVLNLFKKKVEL